MSQNCWREVVGKCDPQFDPVSRGSVSPTHFTGGLVVGGGPYFWTDQFFFSISPIKYNLPFFFHACFNGGFLWSSLSAFNGGFLWSSLSAFMVVSSFTYLQEFYILIYIMVQIPIIFYLFYERKLPTREIIQILSNDESRSLN